MAESKKTTPHVMFTYDKDNGPTIAKGDVARMHVTTAKALETHKIGKITKTNVPHKLAGKFKDE